jgi:TonB family protein
VQRWRLSVLLLLLGLLSLLRPPHVLSQAEAASIRKVLSRVVSQYPELARSMRIDGTVKVLVTVAPDGHCTLARVIGGHPVLAKAAVDAIQKWKWSSNPEETKEGVELHFHPD